MLNLQPHIQLDDSLGIKYALLPGDPARLDRISPFLENAQELKFNREYRSLVGTYKGVKILAMSTGMGGASTGIAVEELHKIGVEAMIRIGSCGSLQPKVKMGDIILVSGAVRDEGTSKTYIDSIFPAVPDTNLLLACLEVAKEKNIPHHTGIARSHDSFYTDDEDAIDAFWSKKGVLGCDMETASLFTIGHLRGVKTASILNNVVDYQGDTFDSIVNYVDGASLSMQGEKNEIIVGLEAFVRLEKGLL
ncbi:uridine phosphorylase [Anaerotignum neopropionicum]|uniref:Uridine phosphorylase n=1 Tax=Anaerotignum neopropionicum TaxID=36847 RepID=A0A136WFG5_9FIRM|nr:nucleoside phosphorylase [Anaerotignum neopropionicum]KXL53143.1 uridine phosphorylase [Anaerotignum neopropionicum]